MGAINIITNNLNNFSKIASEYNEAFKDLVEQFNKSLEEYEKYRMQLNETVKKGGSISEMRSVSVNLKKAEGELIANAYALFSEIYAFLEKISEKVGSIEDEDISSDELDINEVTKYADAVTSVEVVVHHIPYVKVLDDEPNVRAILDDILALLDKLNKLVLLSSMRTQLPVDSEEPSYDVVIDFIRRRVVIKPLKKIDELEQIPYDSISEFIDKVDKNIVLFIDAVVPDDKVYDIDEVYVNLPKLINKPIKVRGMISSIYIPHSRIYSAEVYVNKDRTVKMRFLVPKKPVDKNGRKMKFDEHNLIRTTVQRGVIQVLPERMSRQRTSSKMIRFIVDEPLVNKLSVGEQYIFTAIPIVEDPFNMYEEIKLYVVSAKEITEELNITQEKIEKFKKFKDNLDAILRSFAPEIRIDNIYNRNLKLSFLLSAVKGALGNGMREEIHVLAIGDPSVHKTYLAKVLEELIPKAIYVSGSGVSGAGVTGSVTRDEIIKQWVANAGSITLANGSVLIIDEADKIKEEDIGRLHEAMEIGEVTINKVNVYEKFPAKTSVIMLANPKRGAIRSMDDIYNLLRELNFPPSLVSRFDLVVVALDIPDIENDYKDAKDIYRSARGEKFQAELSPDELKEYIYYVSKLRPKLPKELEDYVASLYVKSRQESMKKGDQIYLIRKRNFVSLLRIATAIAKLKQHEEVTKEDIDEAFELMIFARDIQKLLETKKNVESESEIKDFIKLVAEKNKKKHGTYQFTVKEVVDEMLKSGFYDVDKKDVIEEQVIAYVKYLWNNEKIRPIDKVFGSENEVEDVKAFVFSITDEKIIS